MDVNPFQDEKLSIKNLLFTKAIPNYSLPIPTEGHQTFACTDCGDRFIIKSSYEYHINRKSSKITYFCRNCSVEKIFFNRCDLLSHIRSHTFKTATINISDLKIEPLPLSYYECKSQINREIETLSLSTTSLDNQNDMDYQNVQQKISCFDCKTNIFSSGIIYRDRAKHYTQYTNKLYSCPVCLLTLTTQCALKAHLRIHLKEPPYYCPDCGIHLTPKTILYPYTHDCESFKMMRATAKLKCIVNNCNKIFHPTESHKHVRTHHLKHVYKCPVCSVACYKLDNMQKHFKSIHMGNLKHFDLKKTKHTDFLQCEMCPGRLVIPGQIERHLKSHENDIIISVYPCWTCGVTLKLAKNLLEHHQIFHPDRYIENIFGKFSRDSNIVNPRNLNIIKINPLHSASHKCPKCLRNLTSIYPTNSDLICSCVCVSDSTQKIVCFLCYAPIIQDWNVIKKHYALYHTEHVCLDAKISVKKLSIHEYEQWTNTLQKRKKLNHKEPFSCSVNSDPDNITNNVIYPENNKFMCSKCDQSYENKQRLEKHIVEHRDPFMAYQCMECGESFITKPSFSTHLLVKHAIEDVNNYIEQKKCYSEDSLNLQKSKIEKEPVKENQCSICREQFCNSTDFEKHFRVHGMAFLMKTTNKPISPEKLKADAGTL